MSHNGVSIDQRIRLYFNQGLTKAEIALCLSGSDNIQISTHHLKTPLNENLFFFFFNEICVAFMLACKTIYGPTMTKK